MTKEDQGICVFCRILSGECRSSVVYRDAVCTAFMDIQPINPGHVLIVPDTHVPYLASLDDDVGGHLFRVGKRIAAAIRCSDLTCQGINFFLADGEAAMQEVFHVHLHVFPRYGGDGFGLTFGPQYSKKPKRDELDRVAAIIRFQLKDVGG